jgi:hypothetical protein
MGLHRRCSSITGECTPFPQETDCVKDEYFCSMWRTVGFLISFDVVIELCALVSFIVIISGGVQRRSTGWKVVCSILLLGGVFQCAAMAIVVRFPKPSGSLRNKLNRRTLELKRRGANVCTGLPFRSRRTLLRRLVPRHLLHTVHRILGAPRSHQHRHHGLGAILGGRGWLRTHTELSDGH